MLNEFLEFEAYTKNPTSENPRLQPKMLTHSFSVSHYGRYYLDGINQVLIIIARHFIFSECGKMSDNIVESTIQVLKRWIGMTGNNEKEYPLVNKWFHEYGVESGWLEKYWKFHFEQCCDKERNVDEEWKACVGSRMEGYFKAYDYDANTVTFRNIVASAMSLGPLKERYFIVLKSEDRSDRKKYSTREDKSEVYKKMQMFKYIIDCKGAHASKKLKMLKNIIAFLIWQEEYPKIQNEVILQKIRLFGWYGENDSDGKADNWCFSKCAFTENKDGKAYPIMYRVPFADYTKMGIDPRYLKMHDMRLIDTTETEKYTETHWIIKDSGYGLEFPLIVLNKK